MTALGSAGLIEQDRLQDRQPAYEGAQQIHRLTAGHPPVAGLCGRRQDHGGPCRIGVVRHRYPQILHGPENVSQGVRIRHPEPQCGQVLPAMGLGLSVGGQRSSKLEEPRLGDGRNDPPLRPEHARSREWQIVDPMADQIGSEIAGASSLVLEQRDEVRC